MFLLSLPMRERGLKWFIRATNVMGLLSLPMRERGLKWIPQYGSDARWDVAPHAGAWIEIQIEQNVVIYIQRRSPCGSVD